MKKLRAACPQRAYWSSPCSKVKKEIGRERGVPEHDIISIPAKVVTIATHPCWYHRDEDVSGR